jgi:hypothetical protein
VLIAGLNDEHRTEITLDNVHINDITKTQVHGHFAMVTIGPGGTNIDFSRTDIKVVSAKDHRVVRRIAARINLCLCSNTELFDEVSYRTEK